MTGAPNVLFFGRAGCFRSDAALTHIQALGFQVEVVISSTSGEPLPAWVYQWCGDWIFCFRSYYILPDSVIASAKTGAINFHPGPSNARGRGCLNFALYEGAKEYGVTTHIIEAEVDSGPIIRCDLFPIFPGDDVDSLLQRTHHQLLSSFYDIVSGIRCAGRAYVDELLQTCDVTWSGPLRKLSELNELQVLNAGVTEEQMKRVIRATHTKLFPTQIEVNGTRFFLGQDHK